MSFLAHSAEIIDYFGALSVPFMSCFDNQFLSSVGTMFLALPA